MFKTDIFDSPVTIIVAKINNKIATSLILIKINALNAAFKVLIFVDQKFIKKKDVKPISSHPKNKTNKLPPKTKIHILTINRFINKNKRSTCGS